MRTHAATPLGQHDLTHSRARVANSYFGVSLPHWFAIPLYPHVSPLMHMPQSTVEPQPSAMGPHFAPIDAQVRGVHAFTHAPFLHERLPTQVPQLGVRPPQPFAI